MAGVTYFNSNSFTAGLFVAAGIKASAVPDPWGNQYGINEPMPLPSTKGM